MNGHMQWLVFVWSIAILIVGVSSMIVVNARVAYRRLRGLQRLIEGVCWVTAVVIATVYGGWLFGLGLSILFSVLNLLTYRMTWLQRSLQRGFARRESRLMRATRQWPWLEWFAPPQNDIASEISSQAELLDIVRSSHVLSVNEQKQFEALLQTRHVQIKNIMVPIGQVVTVAADEVLGPLLLDDLHKTGYQQFPVVDGSSLAIIGVLYLDAAIDFRADKRTARQACDRRLGYAETTELAYDVVLRCLDDRSSLVIVRDKQKETVGVVMVRHIIASLLGS